MIQNSIIYKLVRKADMMIIAEGSAKTIRTMRKKTPGTFIGVGSPHSQVGQKFGNPTNYTLIQK